MEGYVHPDFAPVTEKLRKVMSARNARGGAAVAVYHHGELVVDAWTGQRNLEGNPWERDTMAMSFSTTKGVVATVLHRLADRGLVSYDEPVATYWPEFAAAGKDRITIRHLLTHQAGMHPVRSLVSSAQNLLDWEDMVARLAAAEPAWEPGTRSGYHALTYGWLVGEVIRRVTGLSVNDAVQREIAEPLGVDGLFVGLPASERSRAADLLVSPKASERMLRFFQRLERLERYGPLVEAMMVEDFLDIAVTDQIHDSELPAANGVFTARALARMYAALATPDCFDGPPLLSPETTAKATEIQTSERDAVVLFNMRWRLGYHLAGTTAGVLPQGFGHFGFGGSGAWGDPESGLSAALVLNRVTGTPFGDTRFLRVGGAAVRAARRRADGD
ncbi:MAG: serine hydrolase domain-containing protein [Acidimicrobiia bacterium]